MLNTVMATKGQIAKIEKKYIPSKIFKTTTITYDCEDEIFFMKIHCIGYFYEYQVREGIPCFVSLQKENSSYEIPYPQRDAPKLYKRLKEISDKAISDWKKGNYL